MKKQTRFQIIVKAARKELLAAGFKPSRLSMWIHGNRHPSYETAVKLSKILKIPIENIPWVRWEHNR